MAEEIIQKQMTLLPEYQEKFLKDLLANIYQTDEETGEITGIAARSPLFGQPVYQAEGGGTTTDPSLAALDEAGSKIQYYQTAEGEFTTDPTMAEMDQYGQPIFATEGGVAVLVKAGIAEDLHGDAGSLEKEPDFQLIGDPDATVHLHRLVGDQFSQFIEPGLGQAGQQWKLLRGIIDSGQGLEYDRAAQFNL